MSNLVVEHISKSFETRGEKLQVLVDANLTLSQGENVAVVGPSGSGKSTLLHIIGTLDTPTSGSISIDGVNPFSLAAKQIAHFRNETVGFVFQEHHLLPQFSVLENVLVPTLAFGKSSKQHIDRAKELLENVGLIDRLDHRPAELSGGERQRVALARALVLNPKLLLADEPTGSLDRKNANAVGELLLNLQQKENTMLIVVTHSSELAEMLQRQVQITDGVLN